MNKIDVLEPPDIFPKSNILINGKYRFTTTEQKILLLVISRVCEDDVVGQPVKIGWDKIKKIPSMDRYEKILETCSKLKNRDIILKDGNKTTLIGFISGVVIVKGEYVEFMLTEQIRELYIDILKQGNFTLIDLEACMNLSSSVSIRTYELLKSLKFRRQPIRIEVDKLKWLLDMEGKYERDFSTFRVFVLDKAQDDLLKYTDIKFNYTTIKVSRFIKYIDFTITDNKAYQSTIIGELKRQQEMLKENISIDKQGVVEPMSYETQLQMADAYYNNLPLIEQDMVRDDFENYLQDNDKLNYIYIKEKYKGIPHNPFENLEVVDLFVKYINTL